MAEEWRSDDLAGVLSAFATRLTSLVPRPIQRLRPTVRAAPARP